MKTLFCCLVLLSLTGTATSSHGKDNALQFQISVGKGFESFVDLLACPSYMALAPENNGLEFPLAGHPQIANARTVNFRIFSVRFLERKGSLFVYDAQLRLEIAGTERLFKMPVTVNTSAVRTGKVLVTIHVSYTKLLPSTVARSIESAVENLSGDAIQEKLLVTLLRWITRSGREAEAKA